MKKSELVHMPEYFDRYINLIADVTLAEALNETGSNLWQPELSQLVALGDRVYAPGKWTANDIIQHLIDAERILTYRALCFARGEQAMLPPFDEDGYALHTAANNRTLHSLLNEMNNLRRATLDMFTGFTDQMLLREGVAGGRNISVLALGFVVAGHGIHHLNVLKERYYPMI
jgi:hypothetical protein